MGSWLIAAVLVEALDGRVLDRAVHPLDLAVGSTSDRVWSAVTNLSHSASFHPAERIAPSNPGIKQLALPKACLSRPLPFRAEGNGQIFRQRVPPALSRRAGM